MGLGSRSSSASGSGRRRGRRAEPRRGRRPPAGRRRAMSRIIMDGNGRWAHARGLPRGEGHRRGVEALRRAVRFAGRRGIRFLTLFSFSSENWSRPQDEIQGLFNLLRIFIRSDLAELNQNDVRVRVIGERDGAAARYPRPDRGGGRRDARQYRPAARRRLQLRRARRDPARRPQARRGAPSRGEIDPEAIDHGAFAEALDTAGIPDPDLILRTSGEQRISNFLLWQGAYAELVFLPVLWPDFGDEQFEAALAEYRLARTALRRRRWRLSDRRRALQAASCGRGSSPPPCWRRSRWRRRSSAASPFAAARRARGGDRVLGVDRHDRRAASRPGLRIGAAGLPLRRPACAGASSAPTGRSG